MKTGLDDYFVRGNADSDFIKHVTDKRQKVYPYPIVTSMKGHINPIAERVAKSISFRHEIFVKKVEPSSISGYMVLMDNGEIKPLRPEQMPTEFERACDIRKIVVSKDEKDVKTESLVKAHFTEPEGKLIAASRNFTDNSLPLTVVSKCPMLVKRTDGLEIITGYDRETGIYAKGERPIELSIDEALEVIRYTFEEFKFATPSDESRFYACLISSALVLPGILPFREPINFFKADSSQTGKGLLVRCKSAFYNSVPVAVNQQKGGVGGLEESFDTALIYGQTFINLDNLELRNGEIFTSPKLCSFLSEPTYLARTPYMRGVMINPLHHVVMATTNGCTLAIDIANRCAPVHILHQPGRKFRAYPEGGIVEHIQKNHTRYLGAIFAIAKEYYKAGMPRTDVTSHDSGYTPWFQSMDWLVQNLMGLPPLLDGYDKIKVAVISPDFMWLREICGVIKKFEKLGKELTASEIINLMQASGMELSATSKTEPAGSSVIDERKRTEMAFGRKMGSCFKLFGGNDEENITVDNYTINRKRFTREYSGIEKTKELKAYVFKEVNSGGKTGEEKVENTLKPTPGPMGTNTEPMGNQSEPIEPRPTQNNTEKEGNSKTIHNIIWAPVGSIGSDGLRIGSERGSIGSRSIDGQDGGCFSKWLSLPKLVLDFETYYDEDYSLSKFNYIEYLHEPRFKIHGLAVKHPDGKREFWVDASEAVKELQSAYGESFEKVCVVMHNAAFDAYILKVKFGIVTANIIDTMLCARLLHNPMQPASLRELAKRYSLHDKGDLKFMCAVESPTPEQLAELSAYAINDVEITSQLADIMIPKVEPAIEFWIMEHTIKMFLTRPFSVDPQPAIHALKEVDDHLDKELSDAGYTHAQISGNKTFVELLSATLAVTGRSVPMKQGKKELIPAISGDDEAMRELLTDSDPQVKRLAELRILVKSIPNIKSKLEYLISTAALTGGYFPPLIEYHKGGPGRFAGGNGFNIQNMADPDKTSSTICKVAAEGTRKSVRALDGYKLVSCDACQIEARVLSFVSGQLDLHAEFAGKHDVYSEFASEVFKEKVIKTKGSSPGELRMNALRNVGKTAILGLGYSMGADKFIASMKKSPDGKALFDKGILTESMCRKLVSSYRAKYSKVKRFWGDCEDTFISAAGGQSIPLSGNVGLFSDGGTVYIKLPSGRNLVYPDTTISEPRKKVIEYTDESGELRSFETDKSEISYGNNIGLYGGKIAENIVQAIARDILVDVIFRIETAGFPIICHIHDEVICLVKEAEVEKCREKMISEWRKTPVWIGGLVLDAEWRTGNDFGEI